MRGARKDDQYKRWGIIGDNGTGKSTFMLNKLIYPHYDMDANRVLILCDSTPKAYKGITRLRTYEELCKIESGIFLFWDNEIEPELMLLRIIAILREGQQNREKGRPQSEWYLHNGAIVFDDCSNYILPNPPKVVRTFLGNHRMYFIDLFFISHTLTDFPSLLRRRMNYFVLYKTLEQLEEGDLRAFRYPVYKNVYKAWVNRMNHHDRFTPLIIKTGS